MKKAILSQVRQIAKLQRELADMRVRFDSRTKEYHDALRHPNRIEEQLKTWSFALNRLGIGLEIVAEWVRFTKGTISVSLMIDHVLEHGLHTIISMLNQVPGKPMPWNNVDGQHGWKHPDTVKADRDVAIDKANRELKAVGLRVENVREAKPDEED